VTNTFRSWLFIAETKTWFAASTYPLKPQQHSQQFVM